MKFAKGNKPSWRDVLDSQKFDYGHIDEFVSVVKLASYICFEWNGRIYERTKDGYYNDTGWLASDLDDDAEEK